MREPPAPCVRTVDARDRCIVELAGEIDLSNSTRVNLEFEIIFSRTPPPRLVRVDCSRVTFMDSMGLAVLLKARRSAESAGSVLWAEPRSRVIERLLTLSGLTELLATAAE